MEAEVILEYKSEKIAETVADAISPDNFKTPASLSIKTGQISNRVVTIIKSCGKFQTFVATIDDLLFCASTAEKTIQITRSFSEQTIDSAP